MTIAQLATIIGKEADFAVTPNLTVRVVVQDVRQRFGRTDYLVSPVNGSGTQWVDSNGRIVLR